MRSFVLWQVAMLGVFVFCSRHDLPAGPQPPERDRAMNGAWGDRESRLSGQRLLPGSPDHDRDWHLGVEVAYRDYGAEVTHVERRSPARRAGLETRDVIVTVNGYQVGRVNGTVYALDRELALRADRQGRVTFLVQDRRTRQLASLPVRLEPPERRRDPIRSESIIGTIRTSRFTSVPRRGVLTIRLLDVTDRRRPDQVQPDRVQPDRVVAERTYRELGPFPFPFELMYDRDDVDLERDYALDAEIRVSRDTELRTPEPYPVLERAEQGRVHMVLEPVR